MQTCHRQRKMRPTDGILGVWMIAAVGLLALLLTMGVARWTFAQTEATPAAQVSGDAAGAQEAPPGVDIPSEGRQLNSMLLLLFVFLIAIFLGVELLSKVPSQLHTPLMSGSNAISGITIVGACIAAGQGANSYLLIVVGVLAMICAMINVAGGYLVTNRMLQMFVGKGGKK